MPLNIPEITYLDIAAREFLEKLPERSQQLLQKEMVRRGVPLQILILEGLTMIGDNILEEPQPLSETPSASPSATSRVA